MAFVSYDPDSLRQPSEQPMAALPQPSTAATVGRLMQILARALGTPTRWPRPRSWTALAAMASVSARALAYAPVLRRAFPAARVAVAGYGDLVPPVVALGLAIAGIRLVTCQERANLAFLDALGTRADTLLAISETLGAAALTKPSTSVRHAVPVGMWRTDVLHARRAGTPPPVEARPPHSVRIVALPYHAAGSPSDSRATIFTSWTSVSHFIDGVCGVADAHPTARVTIRSKSMTPGVGPPLAQTWQRVEDHARVAVDRDYATPYRSYHLCAEADLVIAKYTSLADECLAVGVPVLLHDFSHQHAAFASGIYDYLPDRLWVHSDAELHERVDWVLADGGADFRAWWEPHRRRIYGDWNDGQVRARLRRHVLALLQGRQ